jgi:hypothetical protein
LESAALRASSWQEVPTAPTVNNAEEIVHPPETTEYVTAPVPDPPLTVSGTCAPNAALDGELRVREA